MATMTQVKYRVLGTNDDASECMCCGRQGLRSVVWLQPLDKDGDDDGAPVHFGRVCGARAAGWGYGSDASRIDRRIRKEEVKARQFYAARISDRIRSLEENGAVVRSLVALRFDWKSGTYSRGYMFTLVGDNIAQLADEHQIGEIAGAKRRLRDAYPIFRTFDERLTTGELKALLA